MITVLGVVIDDDTEGFLRDKCACGDYRPVSDELGPQTPQEWLALIEDEAVVQGDNLHANLPVKKADDAEFAVICDSFRDALQKLAAELRAKGVEPVKFHWQAA